MPTTGGFFQQPEPIGDTALPEMASIDHARDRMIARPRRLCLVLRYHPTMPGMWPSLVTLAPAPATLCTRGPSPPSRPSPRSWQTAGNPCLDDHRPLHSGQRLTPPP